MPTTPPSTEAKRPLLVSLIVPCYNEEPTIGALLTSLERLSFACEVVIVDDASRDASLAVIEQWQRSTPLERVTLIKQQENGGKGRAVWEGVTHATGDVFVIQDADLEYGPPTSRRSWGCSPPARMWTWSTATARPRGNGCRARSRTGSAAR
ncbi:MAG: glycosyltransferase family 2 protein [Planctomycetota bacterium]